jgi:hypothetical protein
MIYLYFSQTFVKRNSLENVSKRPGFGGISVKTDFVSVESHSFLNNKMHNGCNEHTMHIRSTHLYFLEAHFSESFEILSFSFQLELSDLILW